MIEDRVKDFKEHHCWQYDIRVNNVEEDLKEAGISHEEADALTVDDFYFESVTDSSEHKRMVKFIERHEWLGNISQYTTHWFACYYKHKSQSDMFGIENKPLLAGVILMNMPNSFSKIVGDQTKELERLISRGACISWSPKNLASSFMMWSINWMVSNTQYRVFTAYSDPMANELGTIYQACNFIYLGKTHGSGKRYINPYTGKVVSDRYFRQKTAYKKFAAELGIGWCHDWCHSTGMNWDNMPDDIEEMLRTHSKHVQSQSKIVEVSPKHKYVMIKGENRRETRSLMKKFNERCKSYPYPKCRGE